MTRPIIFFTAYLALTVLLSCKTTDKLYKYEYQVCVYKDEKLGQLIKNQRVGIADTITAFVSGKILNNNKNPVTFSIINLRSKKSGIEFNTETDKDGFYSIIIPADNYMLKAISIESPDFSLDSLQLGAGDIHKIDIILGQERGFTTYSIKSKTPLTEKQLEKIGQQ